MQARADIRDYCELPDADRDLIARAAGFAGEHIRPNARGWEARGQAGLPQAVVRAFAESGLLGAPVATDHGGDGASFRARIGMAELMARDCLPSAFSLINLQNGPARIARDGTEDQIERYLADMLAGQVVQCPCLSEPHAGSDFAALKTEARRVDGGWVLEGEKAWITNAMIGDVGLVYAQTDPGSRGRGIAGFLVPMRHADAELGPPYALAIGSVIGVANLKLNGVFVPDGDLFYAPGGAFAKALGSINSARTYVAALCCGMVAEALAIAIDYGSERQAFGKPVVSHQGLRWSIADIATELEAARLLTYRAATLIDAQSDAVVAAAMAKKYAVQLAERRLPDSLQIMGAVGLGREYPIARHLLSAKIAAFIDGSTEMQADRIGRLMTEQK